MSVKYDSQDRNDFMVHRDDGEEPCCFIESEYGLYYMDTTAQGVTLLNTVKDNKMEPREVGMACGNHSLSFTE